MCDYVKKKSLKEPRKIFNDWINKVQKYIKKEYKITFSFLPIGSGSRNMVIKKCNEDYFDLDFQIVIQHMPSHYNLSKNCKELKNIFRKTFDEFKPKGFGHCEDSTQALTTKNSDKKYGFDIIITRCDGDFYILYNKKNTNNANNEDYEWVKRKDIRKYREKLNSIRGPEMWNYLREDYKNKRHIHKNDSEPNKKKSYQLLSEAVVETINHFDTRKK